MQAQKDEEVLADLIPGLPDDVAMECLVRVSGSSLPQMQGVCSRWEGLVKSGQFYEQRRRAGTLRQHLCMVQAFPHPRATDTVTCRDTVTGTGADAGAGADADAYRGAGAYRDTDAGAGAHRDRFRDTGADADTGRGTGAYRGTGRGADTGAHRDRDTGADRDRVTGTDTETGAETETETDTDVDVGSVGLSVFDPMQGSWEWLPLMEDFPHGLPLFCQCVAIHGNLYLLGGWNPSTYETLSSLYIFNFSSRQWSRGADLPEARSFFACGASGGNIFIAGGHDEQKNALRTAEMYLPAENRWQRLPAMSQGRDECFGLIAGGRFFAVSGYGTDTQGQFVRSADVYDPTASTWSRTENFWMAGIAPSPHVVTGSNIYAFLRQQLLQYNLTDGTWRLIDRLPFDGKVAACFWASADDELLIKGFKGTHKGHGWICAYRPGRQGSSGEWQMLQESEADFTGVVQTSCTIEI